MQPMVRCATCAAASAALALAGCMPDTPLQVADTECEKAPATVPSEVTSDPNVNIVMVDRTYPQVLDANEVLIWDGWMAHKALAQTFFCHQPERTVLALEATPGLHKLQVLIRLFGNPGSAYDQLQFNVKSEHPLDVPEDGIIVLNLELSLGEPHVVHDGNELLSPRLQYRETVLPTPARHQNGARPLPNPSSPAP